MNKCKICEKELKIEKICRLCKKNKYLNINEFLIDYYVKKDYQIESLSNERLQELYLRYLIYLNKEKGENPTYKAFWIKRGYSEEQAKIEVNKSNVGSIEYWIERGYDTKEGEKRRREYALVSNNYTIEYWINKGKTVGEATNIIKELKESLVDRTIKNIRTTNRYCVEYWVKHKNYTEDQAKEKILELQHELHKTRDMSNMSAKLKITAACMKRNGLDALNFQHKMNYNRNMNFKYTTETIMFYTRC